MSATARLARLYRYPVEPLQGEQVDRVPVSSTGGLAGDGLWCLRDAVSGERLEPHTVAATAYACAAVDADGQVRVTIPGADRALPIEHADRALSAWLGRRVSAVGRARAAGRGGGRLVLTTTRTLRWIAEHAEEASSVQAARRVRPHLVLDLDAPAFAEQHLVGTDLRIGPAVLRVTGVHRPGPAFEQAHPGASARPGLADTLPPRAPVAVVAHVAAGATLSRDGEVSWC
jgi:uncharacterized protein YcbX